jgi:hypothetical protein
MVDHLEIEGEKQSMNHLHASSPLVLSQSRGGGGNWGHVKKVVLGGALKGDVAGERQMAGPDVLTKVAHVLRATCVRTNTVQGRKQGDPFTLTNSALQECFGTVGGLLQRMLGLVGSSTAPCW